MYLYTFRFVACGDASARKKYTYDEYVVQITHTVVYTWVDSSHHDLLQSVHHLLLLPPVWHPPQSQEQLDLDIGILPSHSLNCSNLLPGVAQKAGKGLPLSFEASHVLVHFSWIAQNCKRVSECIHIV